MHPIFTRTLYLKKGDRAMTKNVSTTRLYVKGMTCPGCEGIIENALKKIPQISGSKADFPGGYIDLYHAEELSGKTLTKISKTLEDAGSYRILSEEERMRAGGFRRFRPLLPVGAALLLFFLLRYFGVDPALLPTVDSSASLGILFVVGLTTSLHCLAMCGGIQISQCTDLSSKSHSWMPALLYNAGRITSYTLLGGLIGAAGSVLSFSPRIQGSIMLGAALFMILMGGHMLFPAHSPFRMALPKSFSALRDRLSRGHGAFVIGILNGFMPCGPLQAMQLYALGTGSFLGGASAMFAFSLGTAPLMFALGTASSLLTRKYQGMMRVAGGGLLLVLALFMAQNGFLLGGFSSSYASESAGLLTSGESQEKVSASLPAPALPPSPAPQPSQEEKAAPQEIRSVVVDVSPRGYAPVEIPAGVPVKLIFRAPQGSLNGCNNAIVIPGLNLRLPLKPGDTETPPFIAKNPGFISYSCWMGMIPGRITIVEEAIKVSQAAAEAASLGEKNSRSAP
jgi:sulfite exporter TauE/SafE/copper chaperone CopZ